MQDFDSEKQQQLVERFENMFEASIADYFDSEDLSLIAEYYLDGGQYKKVKGLLNYGYSLFPGNYHLKIRELEYLILTNHPKEAWSLVFELQNSYPEDLEIKILAAKICSIQEYHDKAIKILQTILETIDDQKDDLYGFLGMEYYNLGDYEKALSFFKKSVNLDQENQIDFKHAILCYKALNLTSKAIDFTENHLDENPFNELAWYELSVLLKNQNRYKDALKCIDFASVLKENVLEYKIQKAQIFEYMENFEGAIEIYEKASNRHEEPSLKIKAALCYKKQNKKPMALKCLFEATRLDPQHHKAWNEIAIIFQENNLLYESLKYINKALYHCPNKISYLRRKVLLCKQLENYEETELVYDMLVDLSPNKKEFWLDFICFFISIGELDKAKTKCLTAIELFPNNGKLLLNIAILLYHKKIYSKAKIYLKDAYNILGAELFKFIENNTMEFYNSNKTQSWIKNLLLK